MGIVRRRTRRRTMMVAGGMAYNRGQNQGTADAAQPQPTYQEVPPAPPPPAPTEESESDEIQHLADLHAAGTLTDDEFSAAKAKLLGI